MKQPEPLFLKNMKGKKVSFLFLALLLPVCVFVFLKFFGRNEFEVPLLFQDGSEFPKDCNRPYTTPYILSDTIMQTIEKGGEAALYLINFSNDQGVLNRFKTEMGEEVRVIEASELSGDSEKTKEIGRCVLLMQASADIVLVDAQKRIRGQYSSAKLDEVDRLLLESKIILKKY